MTPKEFTIWLKGFSKAANEYNITPKQWEAIVEELYNVKDENDQTEVDYEPWYNPYQPDYRTTSGYSNIKAGDDEKTYNLNSVAATALQFPKGTTINYTNSKNKKQQLND